MVSDSADNAAAIVAGFAVISTDSYCSLAAIVLFIYDFIITIGDESKYFWGNRLTGASALFYLNRYLAIAYYVISMFLYSIPLDSASCTTSIRTLSGVIELLLYFSPGAFTALRVFALSQSWALAFPIFVLAVFPTLGVNLARFGFGLTGVELPIVGCEGADSVSVKLAGIFTIVSRTCLITADCLAALVTWLKLPSRHAHDSPRQQGIPGPLARRLNKPVTLTHVLLRDGTIYFIVIGVLNCLHLTFTLLSFQTVVLENISYITALTEPLTAILVSRFLLHLQSVKYRISGVGFSQINSVRFDRMIGSLDAALSPEDFLGFGVGATDVQVMDPTVVPEVSEQSHNDNPSPEGDMEESGPSEVRLEATFKLLQHSSTPMTARPSIA